MIPYEDLAAANKIFFDEYKKSFSATLEKGWFILGENVSSFEKEYAAFHRMKHCIGVASGLDALILSLRSLHLPKESEVIVPSNTYIATILSILHCGLKPILVEPKINTYNIDPNLIEEKINPNTKAIMIVHLYGKSCDMDPILELKNKYNLYLIEDSAQSHGAKYKGKLTGTFGELSAHSFYPTKNLGALGDGGAVLTNDDNLALTIRRLRNYGSDIKYYNELIGYNSRLDEVQAGFLRIKLNFLNNIISHKRKLAEIYHNNLSNDFIKPVVDNNFFDVFHIYNIRHERRDELKKYLFQNGIGTEIHYPVSPHKQNALKHIFVNEEYPISDEIHRTTLSLPISYCHTEDDIFKVVEIINKFK